MAEAHRGSLAEMVFEKLENDIITGDLKPGDALSENMVSTLMGVSRTPVREALGRLEQEGLVEESGHGMVVIGVSERDLFDIYEIRLRIEGLAARYAAKSITDCQLAEMTALVDLQEFYAEKGDAAHMRDIDSQFHGMIYRFCSSRVLADTLANLHHRIERYRRLAVESPDRASRTTAEHRAILEALRERDADKAELLMARHIANARDALSLSENRL